MAITITTLGAFASKAADTTLGGSGEIYSLLASGDVYICVYAADTDSGIGLYFYSPGTGYVDIASTGTAVTATNSGNVVTKIFWSVIDGTIYMPTEGTWYIRVKYSGTPPTEAKAATFYRIRGLNVSALVDKSTSSTGSSTSPSSGATAALTQADELVIGAIGVEDNVEDIAGSWTTGANNVSGNEQQAGTTGGGGASNIVIRSAAEIVSATTAQTAALTGMASADWAACIATFNGAAGPAVYVPRHGFILHQQPGVA